jgi:hypothetical protein
MPQADPDIIRSAIEFWQKIYNEGVSKIKFVKKDGTIRIMKCTLDFEKIPSSKYPKNVDMTKILKRMQKNGIINVFDLEKNDWRSVPFNQVDWLETEKNRYKIRPFK